MARPVGFKILSIFLGLLTFAGFGHFILYLTINPFGFSWPQGICTLAYGITALFASIGLLRYKPWVHLAVDAWIFVVLLTGLALTVHRNPSQAGGTNYVGYIGFFIPLGFLSWYVHKKKPLGYKPVTSKKE